MSSTLSPEPRAIGHPASHPVRLRKNDDRKIIGVLEVESEDELRVLRDALDAYLTTRVAKIADKEVARAMRACLDESD